MSQRKPKYEVKQNVTPFPSKRLPATISIAHYNELITLWMAALDENTQLEAENKLLRSQLTQVKENAAS